VLHKHVPACLIVFPALKQVLVAIGAMEFKAFVQIAVIPTILIHLAIEPVLMENKILL
jgi:hypothetical protein